MDSKMRSFWNRRAEEDAFFFVDNRLDYRNPDMARFWTEGERDLDVLLGRLDAAVLGTDRVLEIGCGVGRLTRVLAARAASVQALDVSERMLELAQRHNGHLENVEWRLGDGTTLGGIEPSSIDSCVSHVVFQHIPDPDITLGYVREIGRVLRPGGWAAFQVSNDPSVHRSPAGTVSVRDRARVLVGRSPRGQRDRHWLGSAIQLSALRDAARHGSMELERVVGEGTQFCCVLTRRLPVPSS